MTDHGNFSHIQKVVIGTYHPPAPPPIALHTQILTPRTGATLRGPQVLDASADSAPRPVTRVQFVLTGGSLRDHVIATAALTLGGWIAKWNTVTIPNGVYTLQSAATEAGGTTLMSSPINVTVDNGLI